MFRTFVMSSLVANAAKFTRGTCILYSIDAIDKYCGLMSMNFGQIDDHLQSILYSTLTVHVDMQIYLRIGLWCGARLVIETCILNRLPPPLHNNRLRFPFIDLVYPLPPANRSAEPIEKRNQKWWRPTMLYLFFFVFFFRFKRISTCNFTVKIWFHFRLFYAR